LLSPTGSWSGTQTGDLIVTVEIVIPKELNDAEREAVERLAAASTLDPRSDLT